MASFGIITVSKMLILCDWMRWRMDFFTLVILDSLWCPSLVLNGLLLRKTKEREEEVASEYNVFLYQTNPTSPPSAGELRWVWFEFKEQIKQQCYKMRPQFYLFPSHDRNSKVAVLHSLPPIFLWSSYIIVTCFVSWT